MDPFLNFLNSALRPRRPYPGVRPSAGTYSKSAFKFEGAHNVILGTIKLAEDDIDLPKKKKRTGSSYTCTRHATARLRTASQLEVKKAWTANLLEGDITCLILEKRAEDTIIPLSLREFELLTIKLVISNVGHEL